MSAPDLTTEVIGFRQWYVTPDLSLRSSHKSQVVWKPGDNRAECHAVAHFTDDSHGSPSHPRPCAGPPGQECHCGFYALHSPQDFWYGPGGYLTFGSASSDPLMSGVVSAWGKIEVHADGFRAEHARIVALARPESRRDTVVARAVATVYGVPLVGADELERVAEEHGSTVPTELRPEKPPRAELASELLANAIHNLNVLVNRSFLYGNYVVNPAPHTQRKRKTIAKPETGYLIPDAVQRARKDKGLAYVDFLPKHKGGRP